MRIVIDARYLSAGISGIGHYSHSLLEHLARLDIVNRYRVLVHAGFDGAIALGNNFELAYLDARPLSLATLTDVGRVVRGFEPDLFHPLCPVTPHGYRGAMIATVHDLQPLMMPEWSGGRTAAAQWAYRRFYRWMYPGTFARAARLLCVSEATRRSLAERFPAFAEKSVAIPSGFDPAPLPPDASAQWERLQNNHGVPSRYVFYVGSTRPNKNLPGMIRAFARMREQNPALSDLFFVLALTPDRFLADIRKTISDCRVASNIRILHHVDAPTRNVLLSRARALFFVTRLEGFGFPILEAQAMGTPVLASTEDASPEIAGAGALLADWEDIDAQAQALQRLLTDDPLREKLIAAGTANLARFRWEETARRTLELYRDVANPAGD